MVLHIGKKLKTCGGNVMKQSDTDNNKGFWRKQCGVIIDKIFAVYGINKAEFIKKSQLNDATLRYWCEGRNFPGAYSMAKLKVYLDENFQSASVKDKRMCEEIKKCFGSENSIAYQRLRSKYPKMNDFLYEVIQFCKDSSQNGISNENLISYPKTGKIQAVVFDFDGTLTMKDNLKSIWERIWVALGYSVRDCQMLHKRFSNEEITHKEWCKLTEEKFRDRKLHRNTLDKLASDLKLLPGTEDLFKELRKRDIKIYIVSGAILSVIQQTLGNLSCYVDEIRANIFTYDEEGYLKHIIGTEFDFEGKASYIKNVAERLQIAAEDILFVGNSNNDQLAYLSGAKTLCINPQLTNVDSKTVWNDYIMTCENLTEILPYIESVT